MNVDIQIEGKRAVIKPRGEMAGSVSQELKPRLLALLEQGVLEFTFDLKDMPMIDSMCIGLLIMCHNSMRKCNGQMELINVPKDPMDGFRLMRLDRQLKITPLQ